MGHGDHNRSFFKLVYRDYCDSKSFKKKNYIVLKKKKLACVDHWMPRQGGGWRGEKEEQEADLKNDSHRDDETHNMIYYIIEVFGNNWKGPTAPLLTCRDTCSLHHDAFSGRRTPS